MNRFALWCARHRLSVVVGWVVMIVALSGAAFTAGSGFNDTTNIPDSESGTAYALLAQQAGAEAVSAESGTIIWHSTGPVDSAEVNQQVTTMLNTVAQQPGVTAVDSPYIPAGSAHINTAANIAYATVAVTPGTDIEPIVAAAQAADSDALQVEAGGQAFTEQPAASHGTEGIGIIAAFIILFLLFRSKWAAFLPILTGLIGVGTSVLAILLASHVLDLTSTSLTMAALIGLGVGIDYAVFIVNRFRKAAAAGVPVPQAIAQAVNTSGRAVIFAGATVIVALLGMFVVNLGLLTGMAQAAAITVAFTVLAALTLLPALLAMLGHKTLSKKQRADLAAGVTAATTTAPHSRAARWAALVQRHPRRIAGAGLLLIVAMAAPVLSMRVADADASSDPVDTPSYAYSAMMTEGFGAGVDAPLLLVAQTPDTAATAAFDSLTQQLPTVPGVASVQTGTQGGISTVTVIPTTSAQSEQTADLIEQLRDDTIPAAEAGTDLQVYVGGTAATSIDLGDALLGKLPIYLGLITLLGFLLLMVAFRSVLVPLVGAISNLATILVGLGAITAIFQLGFGSDLLGVGSGAPIMYLVPVILVGVMFGLSMDYQVFLASRMHEEWGHTRDNARSVRVGLAETTPVIAAAALIMLSVFASFGFSGERIVSAIGIGLAIAVVVDAFVLRLAVVPAVMHLIGRRNWSYPRWAAKITPKLSIEGPAEATVSAEPGSDERLLTTSASGKTNQ